MNSFTFTVYTRRWKSDVTYYVAKIENGWNIRHISINGDCEPDGTPFFYSNFDQDYIAYPSSFNNFLAYIWTSLNMAEMSAETAQQKLQELADWVSACERSQPEWRGWNA